MSSIRFVDSSHSVLLHACPPWAMVNYHAWPTGRALGAHAHDCLQGILVLEGRLDVDWGEGWNTVGVGQLHLLPPGRTHRLRSHGHGQFGFDCRPTADERGLLPTLLALPSPLIADWPAGVTAAAIIQPLLTDTAAHRLAIAAALDQAALALLPAGTASDDHLLAFLSAHSHQAMDVSTAARALGISRSRLQAACRARHGCGVAHLHERLRLERAAGLLLSQPEDPIAFIAQAAGYPDVFAFTRAFRRVLGLPPGAWRRQRLAGG